MSRPSPNDEGQISILTLGFFALLLMVCAVVLGATAVNLQARHLLAAADGAVSAAVEQHAVAPDRLRACRASRSEAVRRSIWRLRGAQSPRGAHGRGGMVGCRRTDSAPASWSPRGAALVHRILPARVEIVQESHARIEVDR
ncbi:pilus assembly protein TadG-related protein [Nesterenkonia pannonica]|uniref:pilus assembly protein TadG-related protein n=1 Tax=Nesterenkonia pannonica TaxID=1548602 RepID=UPI00216477AF|nr:pilus assembly protein TadG-related protein [Nesterenkonia pannonica]